MELKYEYTRKYKYKLLADYTQYCPDLALVNYQFATEFEGACRVWLKCVNGYVTIYEGYAWDGCTLAPDCNENMIACLYHDALRQCVTNDPDCPFNREASDNVFHKLMIETKFKFAYLYYKAVSGPSGWVFSKLCSIFKKSKEKVC